MTRVFNYHDASFSQQFLLLALLCSPVWPYFYSSMKLGSFLWCIFQASNIPFLQKMHIPFSNFHILPMPAMLHWSPSCLNLFDIRYWRLSITRWASKGKVNNFIDQLSHKVSCLSLAISYQGNPCSSLAISVLNWFKTQHFLLVHVVLIPQEGNWL